ncbi:MAG: carbohydrate kinase [Lewinella sp.]|nr:carbohydrate kinase [Lewinella sp.]
MTKIVCFGEVLWDMLPEGRKIGGAPLNVALHLRNFGLESEIIGQVGDDELGAEARTFLAERGLNTQLITTSPELPTSTVEVCLSEGGIAAYEIIHPVAWDRMPLHANAITAVETANALVFGSLAARDAVTRKSLFTYLEHARYKVLDVNLRPPHYEPTTVLALLGEANLVKVNHEELVLICSWLPGSPGGARERLQFLAEKYQIDTLVLSRGNKGAYCYHKGAFIDQPAFMADVVDTIGSGDSFLAAFLAMRLGWQATVPDSLAYACATGAWVAEHAGANPSYRPEDIEQLMADQGWSQSPRPAKSLDHHS